MPDTGCGSGGSRVRVERRTFCLDHRNGCGAASPGAAARVGAVAVAGFRHRCRRPAAPHSLTTLRVSLAEKAGTRGPRRPGRNPVARPLTCARAGTRAGGRGPALSGAGLWLQSRRLKKDAPRQRPRGGAWGTAAGLVGVSKHLGARTSEDGMPAGTGRGAGCGLMRLCPREAT